MNGFAVNIPDLDDLWESEVRKQVRERSLDPGSEDIFAVRRDLGVVVDGGLTDLADLTADVDQRQLGRGVVFEKFFVVRTPEQILERLDRPAASGGLLDVWLTRREVLV